MLPRLFFAWFGKKMKKEPVKRLFSQILPIGLADYYYNNVTALCRIRQQFYCLCLLDTSLGREQWPDKKRLH